MDDTAADLLYESAVAEMRLPHPDNAHIVKVLRRTIDAGSPRAAYALATWYLYGKDDVVAQDYPEAVKLLRIAADVHLDLTRFGGHPDKPGEGEVQEFLHGDQATTSHT